jgi:nitronate monooxygenase
MSGPGRLRTELCDLLGIRHPVVLAGMAGGPATPELVAAVSRAGGLGVFGATGMSADALAAAVRRARELTDAPVGVNVLIAPQTSGNPHAEEVQEHLRPLRRELGLPHPPGPPPARPGTAVELVAAGLEAGARVVSVGLGDPAPVAELARAAGAPLMAMVTTVDEARRSVAGGADAIVAQGSEAGGHRSTFDLPADGSLPMVGTFALVPQVAAAVDVPVVAAGGVMDGRGLVAALALGAGGVQMGTRFLGAREAGVPESYRARLRAARDADTRIIRALSGRPARGLPNRIVEWMGRDAPAPLGWPAQAGAWADIRAAAAEADESELLALWAGQAAALLDAEPLGAEEIVARVMDEARATLAGLSAQPG